MQQNSEHTRIKKTDVDKLLNASQQNSQNCPRKQTQCTVLWLLLVLIFTLIIVLLSGRCLTFKLL